jgi:hypothetical protein
VVRDAGDLLDVVPFEVKINDDVLVSHASSGIEDRARCGDDNVVLLLAGVEQ